MKTNCSYNKIVFPRNRKFTVRFLYCGSPSVSGDQALKNVQVVEKNFQEKLSQEQAKNEQQLKDLGRKLQQSYMKFIEDFQNQLQQYLIQILEVLLPKIKIEKDTFMALVEQLLEKNNSENNLVLHISQEEQMWVKDLQKAWAELCPQLKITIDNSLHSGDMILTSDFGILDNRLQSRLQSLKDRWAHH